MNYYIKRGDQQFGPYSLADLQSYLAQGNIVITDLARGEGVEEWRPVQEVIGNAGIQQPTPPAQQPPQPFGQAPVYSQPQSVAQAQPGIAATAPLPPGLSWVFVLILGIVTCGIFSWIWMFVQSTYATKLRPACNATLLYALGIAGFFGGGVLSGMRGLQELSGLFYLAAIVLIMVGHFNLRSALEEYYNRVEPINLRLHAVMTFFFNVLYFQYHLTRIREWKQTGILR